MNKKAVVAALALVAIIGSFISLYSNRSGRPPHIALNSYEALGQVAAEETASLLGQKGRVVLIAQDTVENSNPAYEAQLEAFGGLLKSKGGVALASIERFKLTPMERMATGGAVPRERFLEVLDAHANADAIVLFVGFPSLADADLDRLKQSGVKLVLVSGYRPGYKGLLTARLLQLAIVPRFDPGTGNTNPPQTTREWFDRDYVIITPDKTSDLPY